MHACMLTAPGRDLAGHSDGCPCTGCSMYGFLTGEVAWCHEGAVRQAALLALRAARRPPSGQQRSMPSHLDAQAGGARGGSPGEQSTQHRHVHAAQHHLAEAGGEGAHGRQGQLCEAGRVVDEAAGLPPWQQSTMRLALGMCCICTRSRIAHPSSKLEFGLAGAEEGSVRACTLDYRRLALPSARSCFSCCARHTSTACRRAARPAGACAATKGLVQLSWADIVSS